VSLDPGLHRTLQAPVIHQHPEVDHPGAGLVSPPQGAVSADTGLNPYILSHWTLPTQSQANGIRIAEAYIALSSISSRDVGIFGGAVAEWTSALL